MKVDRSNEKSIAEKLSSGSVSKLALAFCALALPPAIVYCNMAFPDSHIEAMVFADIDLRDVSDHVGVSSAKIDFDSGRVEVMRMDNSYGSNLPLFEAVRSGSTEAVLALLEPDTQMNPDAPLFVYDPNAEDERGMTPLIEATLLNHTDIVLLLLRHGANAQPAPGFRHTALRAAALTANVSLMWTLLGKGADPNAASEGGRTPLMGACYLRPEYDQRKDRERLSYAAVKFLLTEVNTDPTIRNEAGESALDLCKERKYKKAIKLLEHEVKQREEALKKLAKREEKEEEKKEKELKKKNKGQENKKEEERKANVRVRRNERRNKQV